MKSVNKSHIKVALATYLPNDKIGNALRKIYELEKAVNEHYGINQEIKIDYYGLTLEINVLDNEEQLINSVKDYVSKHRTLYKRSSDKRDIFIKDKNLWKIYKASKDTLVASISDAIHKSRNDCIESIYKGEIWWLWTFVFKYNGYSFKFNPWLTNAYAKLLSDVNKIVKKDRPRRMSKLNSPVNIVKHI